MTDPRPAPKPKSTSKATSGKRAPKQSEDYTIWLPMDGMRVSASWKLAAYGDEGALSDSDKAALADRFGLEPNVVETLSQQLGYCLDNEAEVPLVAVNRAKAIHRAQAPLEEAAGLAKRLERDIQKIANLLEGLSDQFKEHKEDAQILPSAKAHADAVLTASQGLSASIVRAIDTQGAAADISPLNVNHVSDKRRQYVIETCCYAWLDAGRKLTVSTVADGSKADRHAGPLIDFLQDVTRRVTDPSEELSTNTIKKDIDRFRKKFSGPDQLSLPPIKG